MDYHTPMTYKAWKYYGVTHPVWYEAPFMIGSLHRSNEIIENATKQIANALAKKLYEGGYKLKSPNLETGNTLSGWVINADVKSVFDGFPDQYLYRAYQEWLYTRKEWEEKSLWQYLKHWLKRTFCKKEV